MALTLTSDAFMNHAEIPLKYTCEGQDVSPPLSWGDIPSGTKSLVLIVDDPDAPRGTWVHWVVVDLPQGTTHLEEDGALPRGARSGKNDFGNEGWGGPCPPSGRHRYFFKLYALDTLLPKLKSPSKAEVEAAMKGHVLAHAELIGTYQKKNH